MKKSDYIARKKGLKQLRRKRENKIIKQKVKIKKSDELKKKMKEMMQKIQDMKSNMKQGLSKFSKKVK